MQKRGLSALVVSAILVGITVTAVTIVALWGSKYSEDLREKQGDLSTLSLECTSVTVNVLDTSGGVITVENTGGVPLAGVVVVAKGDDGAASSAVYTQELDQGESKTYPYSSIPGVQPPVKEVSIIGTVGAGVYKPCSDQRVDVNL